MVSNFLFFIFFIRLSTVSLVCDSVTFAKFSPTVEKKLLHMSRDWDELFEKVSKSPALLSLVLKWQIDLMLDQSFLGLCLFSKIIFLS